MRIDRIKNQQSDRFQMRLEKTFAISISSMFLCTMTFSCVGNYKSPGQEFYEAFEKATQPLSRDEEIERGLEVGRWRGTLDGIRNRYLYWSNGSLRAEWHETTRGMRNIFTHGSASVFNSDGGLLATFSFNYDELDREMKVFWGNGSIALSAYFVDGIASGTWIARDSLELVIDTKDFSHSRMNLYEVLDKVPTLFPIDYHWWMPREMLTAIEENEMYFQPDITN